MFSSRKGILENKQEFEFEESPDFLEEFLSRYYSTNKIPEEIILPVEVDLSLATYLEKISGKKVRIICPLKGEKKELIELVKKNLEIQISGCDKTLEELKDKLNIDKLPRIIECFDISHLSGTLTVASMVQFRNCKPDKKNYRKFKIRSVEGIDDYASIKEVIFRRYSKIQKDNADFPDLIIIDGGKGQLSSALEELEKLGLNLNLISIAKENEEIFEVGNPEPIVLDKKSSALKIVQQIRDEAHRFAINYNRLLRLKKVREQ
jgi:excinuclease ABC subunit C